MSQIIALVGDVIRRCALQFSESWGTEEYPERHICALYFKCAFTVQTCAFPACDSGCWILHSILRKKCSVNPQIQGVKGCPAHTSNSALHVQMGLTQAASSPNQISESHILSRLAGEGQIHTETL